MHHSFISRILLLLFKASNDASNGGDSVGVLSSGASMCYNLPPVPAPISGDVTTDFQQRYFRIFGPRQPSIQPASLIVNNLWNCWDEKFATQFESITSKVSAKQMFSSFRPAHQDAVAELARLIEENMGHNPNQGLSFLEYLTQHRFDIHPQLLMHAIATAEVSSTSPFLNLPTPALAEIFPTKFFAKVYSALKDQSRSVPRNRIDREGKCLKVNDQWGKENGIENRLWYFREDAQLNMHHWTWHLHHPTQTPAPLPRRGELFYFFHHELIARYAAERMANGFSDYFVDPVLPVDDMMVKQGYDSNLRDGVSSYSWVNRPNDTILNKHTLDKDLYDILLVHKLWWERVENITKYATVLNSTEFVPLKPDGTNTIGELFEASKWGLSSFFYGRGGWHNMAHNLIGSVKVDKSQDGAVGVLADVSTAVRDIVFFRIHRAVNEMFMKYKHRILRPYERTTGDHPLILPGVVAKQVSVKSDRSSDPVNNLTTFWKNRAMDIDGGLDFNSQDVPQPIGEVPVCLKHLDHDEFTYNIELENDGPVEKSVYVRIFMAPRKNAQGQRFRLQEQFPLVFTMDAFEQKLAPGKNRITRRSDDSTLTSPWWRPKKEIEGEIMSNQPSARECTCGYPHHLLLPKGTDTGVEYDLIVMVTDGKDFIPRDQDLPPESCPSSYIHCGLVGKKYANYPDAKPMGYPWDRSPSPTAGATMESFISSIPNMVSTRIVIQHDDAIPKDCSC